MPILFGASFPQAGVGTNYIEQAIQDPTLGYALDRLESNTSTVKSVDTYHHAKAKLSLIKRSRDRIRVFWKVNADAYADRYFRALRRYDISKEKVAEKKQDQKKAKMEEKEAMATNDVRETVKRKKRPLLGPNKKVKSHHTR